MQTHWQVLILTGLVFSGATLGAQPFTVFVHDFAGVEQLVLERAESEAGRILRTVGIEPTWVNCRNSLQPMKACDNPPGTTELVLHVLPGGTARDAQPEGALGFAVPPESGPFGSYAGVLYDRVERLSSMTISKSVVLGHVMAHELGHLLLGVGGHASSGIMNSRWHGEELQKAAQGMLMFRNAERLQISKNVRRRVAQAQITAE